MDDSDQDKGKLKDAVNTRINNVMIYPLSQFEIAFGHLWGEGKVDDELSEEERSNRVKWEQCRNNILDNGNHNRRSAIGFIDRFNVEKRGYKMRFVPKNAYRNRKED